MADLEMHKLKMQSVANLINIFWAYITTLALDEYCFLLKPHSHHNGFYWGLQCSWTLTPANSMQVSIMQMKNNLAYLNSVKWVSDLA